MGSTVESQQTIAGASTAETSISPSACEENFDGVDHVWFGVSDQHRMVAVWTP